jgi:uncharacterized protein
MEKQFFSKLNFRFALFLFALFLITCPVFAILQNGSINIFAVTEDNKGMAAELYMYTIPGTGKSAFITSNSLVGKDTQTTGNIALEIAQKETGAKLVDKDIIFDIRANASEVDGPSAGAAMTLLAYSMFSEKPLQEKIGLTGTINSDGSIGMVGGVGPKSIAASKEGIKLFMIPYGEAVADIQEGKNFQTVNLLEYGPKELGMKVIEVGNIKQAIEYAYSDIDSILVDSNASTQVFIPSSIAYSSALIPMRGVSNNYIKDAETVILDSKKALDESGLSEKLLADFYQKYGESKRNVEMAKRFLDQNYLYSSANYAFNARVLAATVKEIAQNPSMLSSDAVILSKVSALKKELEMLKLKSNYIPINNFEWVIGAQQRMAYAENALNGITSTVVVPEETPLTDAEKELVQQNIQYGKVYDYVSALAWISVSEDFLDEAGKDSNKVIAFYTNDFRKLVDDKLAETDSLLKDSNASDAIYEDAARRYHSAIISRDNNFLMAALYDAYFSESFILSETNRKMISSEKLFNLIQTDINEGSYSDSVWANLFFDHAKFYYENAIFSKKLERMAEYNASLETSYDLIFLSKNLSSVKELVSEYIAFTDFEKYDELVPSVEVKYTRIVDSSQLILIGVLLFAILILVIILIIGVVSRASKQNLNYSSRQDKLKLVLGNLDKALYGKRISDAEYFFMKRRYEDELTKNNVSNSAKKIGVKLSLEDLRAKERALQSALIDIKRHFKEGLIIPEDYEHNSRQIANELEDIKLDIKQAQTDLREQRREKSTFSKFFSNLAKKKEELKGTEELIDQEAKEEQKERAKRKKVLRRFAYSEKAKNKDKKEANSKLGFD